MDRYASYKKDWGSFYENGGIVIADRYTTSNAVHQCSKLPPEQWESFLGWLFDFEFHLLGLPAPDEDKSRVITTTVFRMENKCNIKHFGFKFCIFTVRS